MSLSPWDEGSDSDHETGLTGNLWFAGHPKMPAWQWAGLPRYRREWMVEVRPFTAEERLFVSEAQDLSGEAVKGIRRLRYSLESMRASLVLDQPKT